MEEDKGRYWDARWNDYHIEFKKGKSVWLDLVRYSEIFLKENNDALNPVVNLFFVPNNNRTYIEEILCVNTDSLISILNMNAVFAHQLLELNNKVPRSLNAQASLTINDLKNISVFIVHY